MIPSLLTLTLGLGTLLAQPTTKGVVTDTTEITIGKKVITIVSDSTNKKNIQIDKVAQAPSDSTERRKEKRKPLDVDLINLDLGMNFLTYNQNFDLPAQYSMLENEPLRSSHVGIHLLKTRVNMAKGHFGIVTAVTFDNNRFQWRNNVTLQPGMDTLTMGLDSVSFRKNKLITWHAQIPLLLSFQTNPDNMKKNFHFSVGGYAGLLLGATTKQKSIERGKVKQDDDFNLASFRYGLTARIGFRNIEFYTNYSLSPLFSEGEGPGINPINFGVSITGLM